MRSFDPNRCGWALAAIASAIAVLAALPSAVAQVVIPTQPPQAASQTCDGAMKFTAWTSQSGHQFGAGQREYIFADGAFCDDTDQKFQQFLTQNPPKAPNTIVVLNSPGGIVDAALSMGRMIRKQKMWTMVGSQFPLMIGGNENIPPAAVPYLTKPSAPPFPGYCYSACTETFMGGVVRMIDYASNYGVHQEYYEGTQPPNGVAVGETDTANILAYLTEMGISPDWITLMVKKGPSDVTNLTMKQLQQLNVVTPHWQSTWVIKPLPDNSGFYLDGTTVDAWGTHDIAFTCAPKAAAPAPTPGQPTPPTPPAPASTTPPLLVKFSADPGTRAKAQDLVGHVQQYVVEEGGQLLPLNYVPAAKPPTIDASGRLSATLNVNGPGIEELETTPAIGFAFMFDPAAKLALRLLQFEASLDGALLRQFAATCH